MAPPNTLFNREVANAHVEAAFLEILEFLRDGLGLIDFIPGSDLGGDFLENPRYGQLSAGFEFADVKTPTGSAAATTTTATNERMVVLHRTLFHEFFEATTRTGSVGPDAYSAEIGRQIAIKAAIKLLADVYIVANTSAKAASLDHEEIAYNDTAVPGAQIDMTPQTLQGARFRMTDHMESLDIGVCHSKQWNDMIVDLISNDDFVVPNIVGDVIKGNLFRTVLGVTFIVDDQVPNGVESGDTESSFRALLFRSRFRNPLNEAPIMVSFQRPLIIHEQHVLGLESRKDQLQAEMAYAIGARGSQWDSTNGGTNPSDATLATASNWDASNDDDEQHGVVTFKTN